MENVKNQNSARIKLITAMVIFGTIGVIRKYIPLSSSVVALARAAIGTVFLLIVFTIQKEKIEWTILKKKIVPLLISGVLLGANWICLFEAYNYTTVAVATICYYMAPVFIILVSPFVLKEKITLLQGVCAACSVFGMVLVSNVLETGFSGMRGIVFGLVAAVMYAVIVITNKQLGEISGTVRTLCQLGISAITLSVYVAMTENFDASQWSGKVIILLLVAGIVHTGIAYALYFGCMGDLPARTLALFSYIDPVLAVVLSVVLLKEQMSLLNLIGVVLVIGATIISENVKEK